jgi:serine/threonine protein kinase
MRVPTVGACVGGWTLVAELGEGGSSTVFRAEKDGACRALKFLDKSVKSDDRVAHRFAREASLLQNNLDHRFILKCHALEFHDGWTFLVVDYAPGGSLHSAPTLRDQADVLRWFLQASEALAHAHARGVVHRDVKPGNLLLDGAGNLLVADFGIAKEIGPDATLTQCGTGSTPFMAPEIWLGLARVPTAAGDVYALGITFHWLLSGGEHPLVSAAEYALARNAPAQWMSWHTQRAPRNLLGVDPRVASVIGRMLIRSADRRPSMDSVAAELQHVIAGNVGTTVGTEKFPVDLDEDASTFRTESVERAIPRAFSIERGAALGAHLASSIDSVVDSLLVQSSDQDAAQLAHGVLAEAEDAVRGLLGQLVADMQVFMAQAYGESRTNDLSAHFLVRGPSPKWSRIVRVAGRSHVLLPGAVYDLGNPATTVPFPLARRAFETGLNDDLASLSDVSEITAKSHAFYDGGFAKAYRRADVRARYGSVMVMALHSRTDFPRARTVAEEEAEPVVASAVLCIESSRVGRWTPAQAPQLQSVATPYAVVLSRMILVFARLGPHRPDLWRVRPRVGR